MAFTRRALVQLALAAGRPEEALVQLEAMGELGAFVHCGLARHSVPDLVEAAVRAGRPELGAACWAQRARDELRATGETIRQPDQGRAIDRLTHQELQVARTVSQGLSNREAAAQLFISPRTVDHHLRSIYRKFGITSRAEFVLLADQLTGS